MTRRWKATAKAVFASGLCLSLSGCFWDDHVIPPAPAPDSGGDPGSVAYEHDLVVGWRFPELEQLESLQIIYPSRVSVIQAPDSSASGELDIQIQLFIEKDHHDQYAQEYQNQIVALSQLSSANAVLHVPAPTHPCQKTLDAEGNVTALQGICVEGMTVVIPATHEIPLNIQPGGNFSLQAVALPSLTLTLPATSTATQASISQLTGSLIVGGGGPNASLSVQGASTLDLELNAIAQAQLQNVSGKVHISLAHPDPNHPNAVTLDGKAITTFPFDR